MSTQKVRLWRCRWCGHEEPITENDLQELSPVMAYTGAIKVTCPNCGAYTISKPFDTTFQGGEFMVVVPHIRKGRSLSQKRRKR